MLKGNLSTRPFYNDRLVTLVLGLVGVAAVLLTMFNATQIMSLTAERGTLRAQIEADRAQADRIRGEAGAVQQTIDRSVLASLRQSTEEANALIDQRAFSWTTFFWFVEQTLPIGARLMSVQPQVDRGRFVVILNVNARDLAAVEAFTNNLDGTGAFRGVFVTARQWNDDGTVTATLEAGYEPPGRASAPDAAAQTATGRPDAEGGTR